MATNENQISCDVTTLAACLGVTDRTIQRLAKAGTVVRINRSEYNLPASIQRYIAMLEARAEDSAEYKKARQKSMDLDIEIKQQALAEKSGEFYDRATIDRDFTMYAAEIVKLHKSFVPYLKKRHPKVPKRVWDAIEQRLASIRQAAKNIRISQ